MAQVLLVDDDTKFLTILTSYLVGKGYNVSSAQSEQEVNTQLRQNQFSVVIIDVFLSEANGLDLLYCIKKNTPEIPVIIMSGSREVSIRNQSFLLGGDEFISKPFSLLEFGVRVERIIRYHKALSSEINVKALQKEVYHMDGPFLKQSDETILCRVTKIQSRLLKIFLDMKGQVVRSEILIDQLNSRNENALSVTIHRLNHVLDHNNMNMKIRSIYGFGYTLDNKK